MFPSPSEVNPGAFQDTIIPLGIPVVTTVGSAGAAPTNLLAELRELLELASIAGLDVGTAISPIKANDNVSTILRTALGNLKICWTGFITNLLFLTSKFYTQRYNRIKILKTERLCPL
jgi:hypothetical protein